MTRQSKFPRCLGSPFNFTISHCHSSHTPGQELQADMASHLVSYLPPAEGLLPKWLLFVRKPKDDSQTYD
jgi:hypothetical protein